MRRSRPRAPVFFRRPSLHPRRRGFPVPKNRETSSNLWQSSTLPLPNSKAAGSHCANGSITKRSPRISSTPRARSWPREPGTSIVRPGDPEPLEYTAQSMEGTLSFFKAGAEATAPAKTSGTPQPKTRVESEKNQAESAVEAVRKYNLRNRYLWKRLPDETVAGESAYVLAFEPGPKQNTKSREERFFGLLAGRLWVSRTDFTVLKAEASLQSPCRLFWIIARVTTFQLTYELDPVRTGNRLFRLSKATAKTVVTFPFYSVRQNHWQTVDKYEPRTPRGSGATRYATGGRIFLLVFRKGGVADPYGFSAQDGVIPSRDNAGPR